MLCQYCGRLCKNPNSHRNHERTCPQNLNRVYKNGMLGKQSWNKGLSKHTDPRLAKIAEAAKGRKVKPVSPETRKKLSEICKKRYRDNPELHPNRRLAGNRSKMTYPERIAYDWLSIRGIDFLHNAQVGKYFPDFLIGSLIIEIDGERWHPEDCEKDAIRDEYLRSEGYTIFRIRSQDCIEDRLAEIFNVDFNPESFKPRERRPAPETRIAEKKPKYSEELLRDLFGQVSDAGIDLFSYGWVSRVARLWNVSHTQVRRLFNLYWEGPQPYSRKDKTN